MIATAVERVCFKMAVDRMVPFRFVMVQLILTASLVVYTLITSIKQGSRVTQTQTQNFPQNKLFIMALLDTFQFAGLAVSAAGVSPTTTVILLHASTPCLVLGTRYSFPDRKYSLIQMRGVQLIALAVLVCLVGSISHQFFPGQHESDTMSSLMYVSMAALHGVATLYKEREIIAWSQPMDIHFLSSWLFLYQFIITLMLGPLIYCLQGKHFPRSSQHPPPLFSVILHPMAYVPFLHHRPPPHITPTWIHRILFSNLTAYLSTSPAFNTLKNGSRFTNSPFKPTYYCHLHR